MIVTFTASFFLLANPGMTLTPKLGGFDTKSECSIFASKVIHHIKVASAENYQPIGFKCGPGRGSK